MKGDKGGKRVGVPGTGTDTVRKLWGLQGTVAVGVRRYRERKVMRVGYGICSSCMRMGATGKRVGMGAASA